ncbi:MAG: hypothetical protein HIU92_03895 [Proteobacteria bacterium]|nr:hypothetical protein [Pseudomonadota bacterium]
MSSHTPNHDEPTEPADPTEARMRLALGLGTRPAAGNGGSGGPANPPQTSHDPSRQRRRFAQDGDVPVVMLHRSREGDAGGENRLAALTAELREERAARAKAERALEENHALVNSLRTKLKHAEMTLEDRLRADHDTRAQFDELLTHEREARQRAETRAAEAELALSLRDRQPETPEPAARRATPAKRDLFEEIALPEILLENVVSEPATGSVASGAAAPKRRGRKPKAAATAKADPLPGTASAAGDDESGDQPIEWWLPSFRAGRKAPARRKRTAG